MPATELERTIERFETALQALKEATREANSTLKALQHEKHEIERALGPTARQLVDARIGELVTKQLAEIGPEIHKQSHLVYERLGNQIDLIINLSLGKELSLRKGSEDIRPAIAAKLREWLLEEIEKVQ